MLITCVHQGYELYGSDRSFIDSVRTLRATYPDAEIDVVLPREGPIVAPLRAVASRIAIEPLWVLRRKDLLRRVLSGGVSFPLALWRAWRRLRRSDLVYVNTSVIADYMVASRLFHRRTVIHVHEIPQGAILRFLRALLTWSRAHIVFNSRATRDAFELPTFGLHRVIYNGIDGPRRAEPQTYDASRPLRLLMLGRISRIKGQEVLIEALKLLPASSRPDVRIVGSAFEDTPREENLASMIERMGLAGTVTLMPFTTDTASLYRWADVVVVPSRLPESLGRVAIEAMAFGRPPVASAIGGLVEVVEDGRGGWLVEPDSAPALAAVLRDIVERPAAWRGFPAAARRRYETAFSEAAAAGELEAFFAAVMADRARAPDDAMPPVVTGMAA